jgi:hypothetical protein
MRQQIYCSLYSQTREVPTTLILGRNRGGLLLVFSGVPDYEQSTAKKRTKREKFLADMDKMLPWQPFIDLIENWTSPTDPVVEDTQIKVPTMHFFAGLN